MLKRTLILLAVLLVVGFTSTFAQSNASWPKTFLWRISGNGLTKDSYLYGTMHLQDKRIFNFGDSLYRYLEKAEGYALELDLSEALDSVIQRVIDEKMQYLDDEKRLGNSREKKKIIDSLVNNVKERKDKKSYKILERLRSSKLDAILKKEMPTIMDAFFYGIARRQGKWLGGIEDLQDQLPLMDELGREITSEELLSSDKEMTAMMEGMISIYRSKDLDNIESFFLKNKKEAKDISLIKRNFKMARRMDSLAHIRSMFFTVGVAHLPGDSGVITLLRKKGFRLDPVFSTNTVDPLQYVAGLKSLEWQKNADDNKTYEIEMPGKASEANVAGGLLKMKYYMDLSTLTFFMATSTVVSENIKLDDMIKKSLKDPDGKLLSKKAIEIKGLKGIEANVYTNQNYMKAVYLIRGNILYLLMVGGQKKEMLDGPDVDHFLSSFTPARDLPQVTKKAWKRFELTDKGCSILFPGEPRRNPKMGQGIVNNWNFTTYDFTDPATGTYYVLQVRDIVSGFHLLADSATFNSFRERLSESIKTLLVNEETDFNGYPTLKYGGVEENGVILKSQIINRGNRCYYLIVEGHNTLASQADMNNFLTSFNMLEYKYADWPKQVQSAGNFQSLAPAPFLEEIDTSSTLAENDRPIHFVSYDSADCTSYELLKFKVSPYYYASSDSAFFADIAASYRNPTDSVLSERSVTNGNLKGREWTIQSFGNNNVKRSRVLINGDTVYYFLCYLPSQKINESHYQRFFTDFKVINEDLSTSIYTRKIEKILIDLQSKDSATFSGASEVFAKVNLIATDKPLLEKALLKEYQDDASSSYNTRDRIIDTLEQWMDNNSVDFIKAEFPGLTGNREFMKMGLLDLLARYQTQYSYDALKDLLLRYTPKSIGEYVLTHTIDDSIALTKTLYPEILQLSDNPLFSLRVMAITDIVLLNDGIPVSMLDTYKRRLIQSADSLYAIIAQEKSIPQLTEYIYMLGLMGQMKDAEGNRILKKYLGLGDVDIKQTAIEHLLENGQPVNTKEIEKVAADKYNRKGFYESLHDMGKASLFPAAYNTQQSLAESEVYVFSIDEDYTPSEIKSVGVKTVKYKGKSYQMYLFRVWYEGEDDDGKITKESYLGVSGLYSQNPKDLLSDSQFTTIFFDEEYDAKRNPQRILDHITLYEKGPPKYIK